MTESLYQDVILDHYKHPRGRGLRAPYDAEAYQVNPTCGDELRVRVRLDPGASGPVVGDVSYDGQGCSISQAAASVLHELVVGRTVAEAEQIALAWRALLQGRGRVEPDEDTLGDGVAFAGVARYPARVKCALLAWVAWQDATARAVAQGAPAADPAPSSSTLRPPEEQP